MVSHPTRGGCQPGEFDTDAALGCRFLTCFGIEIITGSAGTYWTIVATAAGCSLGFLNDPIGRPRFFGAAALGHSIFNYEGFFLWKGFVT